MNLPPVQVQGVATLEEPICSTTKRDHSSIQSKVATSIEIGLVLLFIIPYFIGLCVILVLKELYKIHREDKLKR